MFGTCNIFKSLVYNTESYMCRKVKCKELDMSLSDEFEMRQLREEDFESGVKDFLTKFYSRADVLAQVVGASETDENGMYAYRAYVALNYHKASFAIYKRSTGQLAGIKFNFVHSRDKSSTPVSMLATKYDAGEISDKAKTAIKFVENFFGDIYSELGVKSYMESGMVCVDKQFANMGLATQLGMRSSEEAKRLGCECIVSFNTSVFTCKIVEKFIYTLMREIEYDEYVDPDTGGRPFKTVDPQQTHARIYYKRI